MIFLFTNEKQRVLIYLNYFMLFVHVKFYYFSIIYYLYRGRLQDKVRHHRDQIGHLQDRTGRLQDLRCDVCREWWDVCRS